MKQQDRARELAALAGRLLHVGRNWQQVPLLEGKEAHARSPSQQFAVLSDTSMSHAEDIFAEIVRCSRELFGVSGALIVTMRGERAALVASEGLPEAMRWGPGEGDPFRARERLLVQEEPQVHLRGEARWEEAWGAAGYGMVATVPLKLSLGEASLLVLCSERAPEGDEERGALRADLSLLQAQVQVVLEHRGLHWRTRRNTRRLEAVGRALQRLNRVTRPTDTLQTSCEQVRYIFDCSAVWMGLYEEGEGGEVVLRPEAGVSGQEALLEALETAPDTMAGGLYAESAQLSGVMQRATSVGWLIKPEELSRACSQSQHPLRRLLIEETMAETLLVPVWSNRARVGLLVLHRASASELAREDYTVLRIFADHIGLSLWTAELLREARQRTAQLEESEALYRATLQQVSDGVFRLSRAGIFEEVSDFTHELFEQPRESLLGSSLMDQCVAQDRGRAREALKEALGGFSQEVTLTLRRAGGARVVVVRMGPLIHKDQVVGVVGVARDDTRRRALQSRLLVREKQASVGILAEGVAHEINNPLSFIISNINSLKSDYLEERPLFEADERLSMLEESLEGAQRIRDIIRKVRQYSQQRVDSEMYEESLSQLLENALWMVHPEARYKALLLPELSPEALTLRCCPGRLLQVFLNLLLNAVRAVSGEERSRQRVWIRSQQLASGELSVEIEDQGCGIERDALRLVAEPFYTTREEEGSGLGLSMCLEVLEQHGGQLRIDTRLGVGTRVEVRLPVSPEAGPLHPLLVLEYGGVALERA